jgi:hypothetical protein
MNEWYVACRFTTTRRLAGEAVPLPASTSHAKRMGGQTTACGLNAGTWAKLFHLAFPPATGEACPECLDVVRRIGEIQRP